MLQAYHSTGDLSSLFVHVHGRLVAQLSQGLHGLQNLVVWLGQVHDADAGELKVNPHEDESST